MRLPRFNPDNVRVRQGGGGVGTGGKEERTLGQLGGVGVVDQLDEALVHPPTLT